MPGVRVLVATQAQLDSTRVVEVLREAGYSVQRAGDAAAALKVIHTSNFPLIVILDTTSTRLLNAILTSRRLLHRHAYVLMAHEPLLLAPAYMALCARLTLFIVHMPFNRDHLITVVAQAARCLGSVHPIVAEHDSMGTIGSGQAYNRTCAGGEAPGVRDDRAVPP